MIRHRKIDSVLSRHAILGENPLFKGLFRLDWSFQPPWHQDCYECCHG